jgi:uracil-DNA glycosylase
MIMISECAPADARDHYYSRGRPLFAETTLQAFKDAGENVSGMKDILDLGVYMTTAIKCGKRGPVVPKEDIWSCSALLDRELSLFPRVSVLLLMGDAAIHAVNCIAKRRGLKRVIPAGSTYKIRGGTFELEGIRLFPSYLQAGPSFFIEKTKRRMIAEDIAAGLKLIR